MSTTDEILKSVESVEPTLREVALSRHTNSELELGEHKSSKLLAATFAKFGFEVEKSFAGLHTAFKAEYDALPGMGHACGHNLIAVSALAAGQALADVLKSKGLDGSVVVMGTPGEEEDGGKVLMLKGGSDTLACIAGGIAQAFYTKIPENVIIETRASLTEELLEVLDEFNDTFTCVC
ncbi:MAG: hypothetical protein KAG97_05495 [Victivallales bacterium]|nr:hypothetical protein [Victivallales bacterium]